MLAQDVWMRRLGEVGSRWTAGETVDATYKAIRNQPIASGHQ